MSAAIAAPDPVLEMMPLLPCVFAVVYIACNIYVLRNQPVIVTDALVYHFPVAVDWLRNGHLSLISTWFFNPANTYSPLAGSLFIAWLYAPQGNDVIAQFVQVGPLLLIFFAMLEVCGRVVMTPRLDEDNANQDRMCPMLTAVAGCIAAGVIGFRPLLGEVALGKDDLFLAAFFLAAVAGCAPIACGSR